VKKLCVVPAVLLLCLLGACWGPKGPSATTAETTAAPIISTNIEIPTQDDPEPTQPGPNELLDFMLIDRLFHMKLTDFFREEGAEKQSEGDFEGGPYYSFSKYDPDSYFFFGGSDGRPSSMALEAPDLLVGHQPITLGELKNWLDASEIRYRIGEDEDGGFTFLFTVGKYTFFAFTGNSIENDDDVVNRFFIKPKD